MKGCAAILTLGAFLMLILNIQCSEDIVSVINRIDVLEEDITRVEERTRYKIDSAKISLQSELKQHLHQQVSEAMGEILQGESLEEMVRSQILSEVRQLKRGNHQIKRQLHQVLTSNRVMQEELNTYKEDLKKIDENARNTKTCSKYIVNIELMKKDNAMLRNDLDQCKSNTEIYRELAEEKDKELLKMEDSLSRLNQTYQLHLGDVTTSMSTTPTTTSTPESTTVSTSVATTTAKPEEERSRIIVAPVYITYPYQLHQLNIHNNTIKTYTLRGLKDVLSLAYVSKFKKLLIGLSGPDRITSSNIDSNDVITLQVNVRTWGMAVDDGRDLVFMTTQKPRHTISRMTSQGTNVTVLIDLRGGGSIPRAIAVNIKEMKIYACNGVNVFTVTYDGRQLQTLATGSSMFALTLDNTGNILYYNDDKKLMSLSQNVTREVTTLNASLWSIVYYNNTVYFSSHMSPASVGTVDVVHNTVTYILQPYRDVTRYVMCLVP